MALVANYASSDEDSDPDEAFEDDAKTDLTRTETKINGDTNSPIENPYPEEVPEHSSLISDDEDEDGHNRGATSLLDEVAEDIPGLSSSKSFFASLPSSSSEQQASRTDFFDAEEDLSTIPNPKDTEKASVPLKPNKRKGPVRIVLPLLADVGDDDDEKSGAEKRRKKSEAPAGSALLSLLPAPKNSVPTKEASRAFVPHAVSRKPHQPAKLAPKMPEKRADPDSESDDEDVHAPFFTLESSTPMPVLPSFTAASSVGALKVNANPHALGPSDRPLSFKGFQPSVAEEQPGPSHEASSSVGPARPAQPQQSYYPEPEDLMANEEALNRLAGKHALKNKEDFSVVDVQGSSLTADSREWLTKALTEDDPDKPGPRCMVKGQTRKKHQITYLAALAKENEHKLKEQWSRNAASKKAAGAKYGF